MIKKITRGSNTFAQTEVSTVYHKNQGDLWYYDVAVYTVNIKITIPT